ncbi:hypothetical protein LTR78_005779 [Recurvomyces mirabilis]|uniref:Uncharacterized protein n=1 Tax=Recurvomyces mirabilis TaxID=574656 RepID=A0AAE0WM91_9PEZI|nr:hypothetical protein LTR78_005779 [Recurvomyces mirabilis]KAK5154159.1 hypothetical protein LTS14_006844 [Recurvomyces mirabilis]
MAFNRRPPPNQQQQPPVSFKTVPGRNRTQKWQQAKTYNYDGDDWGGYDPYDEYSGYDDEPPASANPNPAQIPPQQQRQEPRPQRQNSFDTGDERRAFSGSQLHPSGSGIEGPRGVSPGSSSGGRPSGDYAREFVGMGGAGRGGVDFHDPRSRDRNFTNPEQVPPPLNTRTSPARVPAQASISSPGQAFPPRKSSVSQGSSSSSPVVAAADSAPATAKVLDKPLPFIRPADIYKRMAEEKERERQSMDSSRPSMDSVQREATSPLARATDSPAPSLQQQRNLHPVVERDEVVESLPHAARRELPQSQPVPAVEESRAHEQLQAPVPSSVPEPSPLRDVGTEPQYQPLASLQEYDVPTFGEPTADVAEKVEDPSPRLPPVSRFSGFGSDFIHGSSAGEVTAPTPARAAEPIEHQSATRSPISSSSSSPQDDHFQSTIMRVLTSPIEAVSSHPDSHEPQAQYSPTLQHERTTDLQHHPSTASTGLTSVVHTAFDHPHSHTNLSPTDLSRDNSQSMSRSDTTSTSTGGISPIMAHVPAPFSAAGQIRDNIPPSIAEEATPTQSRQTSGVHDYLPDPAPMAQRQSIPRKPSPNHSRNASAESYGPAATAAGIVQPGYRRSLDPPSSGSSPARTPAIEHGYEHRRVSTPQAAQTMNTVQPGEEPDVIDQAAEVPVPFLHPATDAKTPATEMGDVLDGSASHLSAHSASQHLQRGDDGSGELVGPAATAAAVQQARGEDYTAREVDLARLSIPNETNGESTHSPPIAQAETASQQQFLRTHERMPVGPGPIPALPSSPAYYSGSPAFARPVSPNIAASAPGLGLTRSGTSGSPNANSNTNLNALTQSPSGQSGRDSPVNAKGRRVREIAENYNSLDDASRRNSASSLISSKSSWSQFGGQGHQSEEDLTRVGGGHHSRKETGSSGSLLASASGSPVKDDIEGEDRDDVFATHERDGDGRTPRQSTALQPASVEHGLSGASPRSQLQSQNSFRPHLPGEWVSFAPTPAGEEPPTMNPAAAVHEQIYDHEPMRRDLEAPRAGAAEPSSPLTPRASHIQSQEDEGPVDLTPTTRQNRITSREFSPPTAPGHVEDAGAGSQMNEPIDLTPTTRKTTLRGQEFTPPTTLSQVKDAGAALGASLMGMTGLATTARDFGSSEPAAPVEQPEMRAKAGYGDVSHYLRPEMGIRNDSEVSAATDIDERSVASAASSVPPTPPAKDTPAQFGSGFGAGMAGDQREIGPGGRPISHYFSGAVPPLRTGHPRETSTDQARLSAVRPGMLPQLSTDTGFDDTENDRLRKEIVRSLDPARKEEMKRESIMEAKEQEEEDSERLQDALDAPENERRIGAGEVALPAAEAQAGGKPLPRMLDQRFSWESRPKGLLSPTMANAPQAHAQHEHEQELRAPEVLPEMPYERPRSRGLHVMNAGDSDDESPAMERSSQAVERGAAMDSAPVSALTGSVAGSLGAGLTPLVSPVSRHQHEDGARLRSFDPSPIRGDELETTTSRDSESTRLPSYYQTDLPGSLPEPAATVAGPRDMSPTLPEKDNSADLPVPTITTATDFDTKASSPPTSTKQSTRIPPFREILAIKSSPERIRTYDDTRTTFSQMDTGLAGWLSDMLVQHPEHANIGNAPSATAIRGASGVGPGMYKHRASPSMAKFTKPFAGTAGSGSGSGSGLGGESRKVSTGFGSGSGGGSGSGMGGGEGGMADVQQKGKEFMKTAGVLGGKAQAGAKGLFQRGKLRLGSRREGGGEKALPSSTASRSVAPPLPLPTSKFSQYTPAVSSTTSNSATPGTASPTGSTTSLNQPATTISSRPAPPAARARTPISTLAPITVPVPASAPSMPISTPGPPATSALAPLSVPAPPAPSATLIPRPQAANYDEPTSSSRPFSRTLTRLRDHSRGKSASAFGRSKSKSRPPSLVIPTSNADLFPNWGDGDQRESERASKNAAAKGQGMVGPPAPRRIEAWEDDASEGAIRQATDDGSQDTPGRLGVLPSPVGETFGSFSEIGGRERKMSEVLNSPLEAQGAVGKIEGRPLGSAAEDSAITHSLPPADVAETKLKGDEHDSNIDAIPSTDLEDESPNIATTSVTAIAAAVANPGPAITPADISREAHVPTPVNTASMNHGTIHAEPLAQDQAQHKALVALPSEEEPMAAPHVSDVPHPPRPQQIRKVSAIASLPSQQRSRALSSPQPPVPFISRSPPPILQSDEYVPTQRVMARPTTVSNVLQPEGMADQVVSRSDTTEHSTADRRSEISAEGGADDDSVIHARVLEPGHSDLSRQSSVSSLGDHESTVVPIHGPGNHVERQEELHGASDPYRAGMVLPETLPLPVTRETVVDAEHYRDSPVSATMVPLPSIAQNIAPIEQVKTEADNGSYGRANDFEGANEFAVSSPLSTTETHARHPGETPVAVLDEAPVAVGLTGSGVPSSGTPPFQHHPLIRNSGTVQPTEYERLRSSQYGTPTPSAQHSRQVSNDDSKRNSRRYSGFFRGPDSAANTPPPMPTAAPDMSKDPNTADTEQADKAAKRKSGIWQTFKRSPSASHTDFARDIRQPPELAPSASTSDAAMIAAISARESPVDPQRLKKIHRAASATTPPVELKPRRFSGLGSLFGRSQTQGRNVEKPRKLTKMQPPSRRSTARQELSNDGTSRGYDDFEAMRRQQIPDLQASRSPNPKQYMTSAVPQQHRMSYDAQSPVGDQRSMLSPSSQPPPQGWYGSYGDHTVQQGQRDQVQSPPQGWYGPGSERTSFDGQPDVRTPYLTQHEPRPQYRRLHSEGQSSRGLPQADIPEAFRSTEASYGRQAEPIGPPADVPSPIQGPPPGTQLPTLPTQQPYWVAPRSPEIRSPPLAIPRHRQVLPISAMPPILPQNPINAEANDGGCSQQSQAPPGPRVQSPPAAECQGLPQYQRQSSSNSQTSAREINNSSLQSSENARRVSSPPMPRMQSPAAQDPRFQRQPFQHQRVMSSPLQHHRPEQSYPDYPAVNAYQSQQRPPWSSGQPLMSQEQSYTSSRYPVQVRPPPPQQRWQSPSMPLSPQSPQGDPTPQSGWAPPLQNDHFGPQHYPSPPHSAQSPRPQEVYQPNMSPTSHYDSRYPPPMRPHHGQKYYPETYTGQPTADGRPLAYQHTPSGYSGRRDDAAVSEQELGMRSSSYPGQEWQPRV